MNTVRCFFKKHQRIRRARDFEALRAIRQKIEAQTFFIKIRLRGDSAVARFAVITSRKVGKALIRNKLRRRSKEIFRSYQHNLPRGYDILLIARSSLANMPFHEMEKRFKDAMERAFKNQPHQPMLPSSLVD